jgi:hypothetical protein
MGRRYKGGAVGGDTWGGDTRVGQGEERKEIHIMH